MIDPQTVQLLYDYTYWAHGKVWQCALTLSDDAYFRDIGYSWGSVHKQFVHVMSAEWMWLSRLKGVSPTTMLNPDDFPAREAVKAHWASVEADIRAYLKTLTPEVIVADFDYKSTKGDPFRNKVGHILLHVVNHGTDHRAQILEMIHQLGGQTIEQDLIFYLRQL